MVVIVQTKTDTLTYDKAVRTWMDSAGFYSVMYEATGGKLFWDIYPREVLLKVTQEPEV